MSIKHLSYDIEEKTDRFYFYETLWKQRGMELLLRNCAAQGKTLLDYGSGRGECMKMAKEAGFKPHGTDVDPECLSRSSKFGEVTKLEPDHPLKQFGPRSFDVVTCFHVLEHVDSPKHTLTALAQIAREFVVLAVPNLRYLHRTFRRQLRLGGAVNEGHLQSWDHWHLLNLAVTHCGLELVEWGTDATILPFFSQISQKVFGTKMTIKLETGLFRKMFPYHGVSVLGLFRPRAAGKAP
jgi:2-polyprenyl-3-methyl-5-hydroxy-6-metoxy-1,4-benzoquinol methylase